MEKAYLFQDRLPILNYDEELKCEGIDNQSFLDLGNYIYNLQYKKSLYNLKMKQLEIMEFKLLNYKFELEELNVLKKQIKENIINLNSNRNSNTSTFLIEYFNRKSVDHKSYYSLVKKQNEINYKLQRITKKQNNLLEKIKELAIWINKFNQEENVYF
jgi:hypothetical protein